MQDEVPHIHHTKDKETCFNFLKDLSLQPVALKVAK